MMVNINILWSSSETQVVALSALQKLIYIIPLTQFTISKISSLKCKMG